MALKYKYRKTVGDTIGRNFYGLRLDQDYTNGCVNISMSKYVALMLGKLNYKRKKKT